MEFGTPSGFSRDIWLNYNSSSGLWEGTYQVKSTDEPGVWTSGYMFLSDNAGNYGAINPNLSVTIVNDTGNVDNEIPKVESVVVNPAEANVGDMITIEAKITDSSGVKASLVEFGTPSGFSRDIWLDYNSASGLWEGTYQVKSTDEPGVWTSGYMFLSDNAGNYGAINPNLSITIVNDTGDIDNEIPKVDSVVVNPAEANVGDMITIEAKITDSSGVKASLVEFGTPSGFSRDIWLDYNSASGLWEGTYQVKSTDEPGVWTSGYMFLSDNAGNYGAINPNLSVTIILDDVSPEIPSVNAVTDISTSVSGTAEAKSTVHVKSGTTVLGTVIAQDDETFTVPILLQKAGTQLTVIATDRSGNSSEPNEVTVTDVTAPSTPTVNKVTDKSIYVTGTAEGNSTIIIKVGSVEIGAGLTAVEGTFNIIIPKQQAGSILIITATDSAKNSSEAKEVTVADVTAPTVPEVNEVTDKSTSVTGIAEVGSTITVKEGATVIGTTTTDTEEKYVATILKQKAGTKLTVIATDNVGNISEPKEVTVEDITAPTAPTVNEVTDKSTSVTGSAEPGSAITIKVGTKVLETGKTVNDGSFIISIPQQKAGIKLTVISTDTAGNKSDPIEITVTDATDPLVPTVNEVTDKSTSVSGTAEVGSLIKIKTGTTEIGSRTVDSEGNFTVQITQQKAGMKLSVTATDTAGNESEIREVTVVDVTAPTMPTVNEVTDKSTSVTGSAEVGSSITIKVGTTIVGTGTTITDGKFSVEIPNQKAKEILTVTATDAAGNVSAEAKQTVVEAPPEVTNRIAGNDRYATAVSISQEGWETAETVILATGANFPDALAGGPLAYKEEAPILLTRPTRLVEVTELEIKRLNAKKVIILGSKGAISLDVETQLKKMGLVIERIGGENRFETAALIAERLPSEQAIIAYGFNFPDVLSISPYAAKNGIPILLTRSDRVPAETLNAMADKNNTIIVGSTGVISESVMKQFPKPVRYGGATRFDTGKQIITQLQMGTGKAYVATGRNFPDALAGSVLAAKNDAPILLVNETTIPTPTKDLLFNYDSFSIFGSRGAVGDEVQNELDLALEK